MENKDLMLWVVIGILAILVIYVAFFRGSADVESFSSAGQAAQTAYSGMVGGC